MIDNYRFKRPRDQELTDEDFAAFVDLNPRLATLTLLRFLLHLHIHFILSLYVLSLS